VAEFQPLYRSRPAHRWTYGDLACKVGADLGLPPDAEQQWLLDTIYAEKAPDRPASFEVVTIAPRQNIKTSTNGIAALADLFVFGIERHIWSSHLLDTSKGTFRDFKTWIDSNHEYASQVRYLEGHQDLAIIRTNPETGAEQFIEFRSRTGKASRGLTGVKRITLDEWLFGEPKHVGAVFPTMLTRPGAQVREMSSAGLLASKQLRALRDRGRTGKDGRLAYVEYGAKRRRCADPKCSHKYGLVEGCALDDRELWWQASCALWSGRILEESIEDLRKSMPPEEFMREMLSWWEDPISVGGALPYDEWLALAAPGEDRGSPVVFGVDLSGERDVWVAVAWRRSDGHTMVTLANKGRPLGAHEAVRELGRLQQKWGGMVATSAFLEELEKAGVQTVAVSGTEFAAACGALEDGINDGTLHHHNQSALNEAVRAAKWRPALASGERAIQLKDMPEVGPAAAAARALHGLSQAGPFFGTWR
jgi:hypothetical protein